MLSKHLIFSGLLILPSLLLAQEQPAEGEKDPEPVIKKIDSNTVMVGKVTVKKNEREISFPAAIGEPDTILEYLVVNQRGKVHETLLTTEIWPSHLNIAIKLMGYKASKELFLVLDENYTPTGEYHTENEETKKASRIDIFVSWKQDGKVKEYNVNELIMDATTKKHAHVEPYIYGGSYLFEGKFKPDLSGDLIAIFTDRSAIANFSNEGREDDTRWYPSAKRLPKPGTPVTITIRKHKALGQ